MALISSMELIAIELPYIPPYTPDHMMLGSDIYTMLSQGIAELPRLLLRQ
jgi:hypothetical protein